MTEEFPGWEAGEFGTMTLTVMIGGEEIRPATVTFDQETGLYETYIGLPMAVDGSGTGRRGFSGR